MSVEVREFGTTEDGRKVSLYILKNPNGLEASFTDLGAAWVSMLVPDRQGEFKDVVFGYEDAAVYEKNPTSCGECVGRNANRIAGGEVPLGGKVYQLEKNEKGVNSLHSGPDKWAKVLFEGKTEDTKLGSRVVFTYRAPDMSQGFPGNLDFSVSYTLAGDDSLIIEYLGKTDALTVINPTNHAYFNLAGHDAGADAAMQQLVWINADYYTPVDENLVPTGELASVTGTPMDFSFMKPIGQDIGADFAQIGIAGGFDHNYVLNSWDGKIRLAAKAKDPESGRKMKVYTTLPGIQFYTGNSLKEEAAKGKGGAVYGRRSGFCFETQFFPDAVHHPDWPQPVFQAGESYHHFTIYKFDTTRLVTDVPETLADTAGAES